ncbi:MAG: DUF6273 domain-containing protein [bacterium]|nr:DUF6273 domain-containing protein [bacterium]
MPSDTKDSTSGSMNGAFDAAAPNTGAAAPNTGAAAPNTVAADSEGATNVTSAAPDDVGTSAGAGAASGASVADNAGAGAAQEAETNDRLTKLAVIAGVAGMVAVCIFIFLSYKGTICYDALTGPVVKNTYVRFGRYPQKEAKPEAAEPIVWEVLDNNGEEALLFSQKILFMHPWYVPSDEEWAQVRKSGTEMQTQHWEGSDLRKYLNDDFYNAAFNEEEKSRICISHLSNLPNPWERKKSSQPNTDDKVFVLSYYEMNELKPLNKTVRSPHVSNGWRSSYATEHAIKQGARLHRINYYFFSVDGYYEYWVRGMEVGGTAIMALSNIFIVSPCDVPQGVRPALRIKVK